MYSVIDRYTFKSVSVFLQPSPASCAVLKVEIFIEVVCAPILDLLSNSGVLAICHSLTHELPFGKS